MDVAVVALTKAGAATARRIAAALPGAQVHGLDRRVADADVPFANTAAHLRALFEAGTAIVGVCAAGILIRALAPVLSDKRDEPPVLAVATDGASVVPLLGGHAGGNRLAEQVATALDATAALTTGGETALGLALDDPPPGWTVVNPAAAKITMAALLGGDPVALEVEAGDAGWLRVPHLVWRRPAPLTVRVTDRAVTPRPAELLLNPPTLALGVGCERGADPAEVHELAMAALAEHDLAPGSVAAVVSLDLKADEPAVHALAQALACPARFFDAATLEAETPRLKNPSAAVFKEVGCHGVAEGAALAAAGPDAALVVPKRKSRRATVAVARARAVAPDVGRPQGTLAVVGLGPGRAASRTVETDTALRRATDVVGYGLYLDLAGTALAHAARHAFALGEEEARVRKALDLAAMGRAVALVTSGDPGVYAMATLVFELLERGKRADWRRVAVSVLPGVSVMQAAAARAGAPLGHDFCAISLSDLLTPWAAIRRRLEAAAAGDFVTALYNPRSVGRAGHLAKALKILRAERPAKTPVVIARNLGRDGEHCETVPLDTVDPETIDMLTVLIVGASTTRAFATPSAQWTYTPRGYRVRRKKKYVADESTRTLNKEKS